MTQKLLVALIGLLGLNNAQRVYAMDEGLHDDVREIVKTTIVPKVIETSAAKLDRLWKERRASAEVHNHSLKLRDECSDIVQGMGVLGLAGTGAFAAGAVVGTSLTGGLLPYVLVGSGLGCLIGDVVGTGIVLGSVITAPAGLGWMYYAGKVKWYRLKDEKIDGEISELHREERELQKKERQQKEWDLMLNRIMSEMMTEKGSNQMMSKITNDFDYYIRNTNNSDYYTKNANIIKYEIKN